ncbi:MAG: hypothetical protein U9Q15_03375 [Patescibacteria group bacterium]|nr:hypothetical protein [Patescibacteria group bacterium]
MLYFHLGHKPLISLAEIEKITGHVPHRESKFLASMSDTPLRENMKEMGSITKISEYAGTIDAPASLAKLIGPGLQEVEGKIKIGISLITDDKDLRFPDTLKIKRILSKDYGLSIRMIDPIGKNRELNSAQIGKNKLINNPKGREFNLIRQEDNSWRVTQTKWIQDYQMLSKIDYERPCADGKNGMLPPKLAQTMINLSGGSKHITRFYDPFCGNGTLLLMGQYLNIECAGSDINPDIVKEAETNIQWMIEQMDGDTKQPQVSTEDALDRSYAGYSHIISEGYLGKPKKSLPTQEERMQEEREIHKLYTSFIKQVAQTADKGCKILLCVPCFQVKPGRFAGITKDILKYANANGLSSMSISGQTSITYARTNQIVGRDIIFLKRS